MRTFCLATVLALTSLAPVCSRAAAADSLIPTGLRVEYRVNPLGIDVVHPRLSWVLESDERDQAQPGYQILVATSVDKLSPADADLWDSGSPLQDRLR